MTVTTPASRALGEALADLDASALEVARARAIIAELRTVHTRDGAACSCGTTWPCPTTRILDRHAGTQ